ncbi:hypothetical protein KJQ97_00735 [Campylobacter sp. 2018MI01]|uniref:hypothetical protein n=1 Tax=Campylobacter sp. 2018MI01 TaxID=2836735 RepID=UPI001BD99A1F|nr:hypothetical protein [Campylobacter sp. 2018MI01]MBT0877957.1 hypothetical protein [Campylobacter sp. 2018MI01]
MKKIKDYEEAIKIYKKTCDNGYFPSCERLFLMYKNGDRVKQDLNLAKKYLADVCRYSPEYCEELEINEEEIFNQEVK